MKRVSRLMKGSPRRIGAEEEKGEVNHMKRVLSIFLALCMVLVLLPFGAVEAHAETNTFSFTNDANAYQFSKSGNDILITSEEDWNALSAAVKSGYTCKNLSFKLTADISVSLMVGEQVGNAKRRFAGSFDGNGHTLTVNYDATAKAGQFMSNQNYVAPFAFADRITVKNLTVDGTIKTNHCYAAGVVASLTNGGRIENVTVNATIVSTMVCDDGMHGGFVAVNENGPRGRCDRSPLLVFKSCSFNGSLLGEGTYNCGGFVGNNKAKVWVENCLFNPLELTVNDKWYYDWSDTFVRNEYTNPYCNVIYVCYNYYTRLLGTVDFWAIRACGIVIDADEGCTVTVKANGRVLNNRDIVLPGTRITVEVEAKPGYELTQVPNESYTVCQNLTITARSQAVEQGYVVTLNHEHGAEPTWSGVQSLTNAHYSDYLTITAGEPDEGYVFIGWYKPNGMLLTKEETYNAYVYCDVTYEARYQLAAHKVVHFISNDCVMKTLDDVDSITAADFPEDPVPAIGSRVVRWSMTAEEVNEALASEAMAMGGTVTVTAQFEKIEDAIIVTVNNGEQAEPEVVTLSGSQFYRLAAAEVPGKYFDHWVCVQDGEYEVVSYRKTGVFWMTKDATVTAVYSDTPVEQDATAILSSVRYNAETAKLTSASFLSVPETGTIRAAGVLAASNKEESKYTAGEELTTDNADYVKVYADACGKSDSFTYIWTKKDVKNPGETWYLRPYVIYADEMGVEHTVYGEMRTASLEFNGSLAEITVQ